ncbi:MULTISPECIES: PGF-CTERM sorting domain-containing protein [Haloferacaceae]|uniref:PGF-CTERM sorting domain-containing protein n=1 Tax=Halorubrum glutamatedens TaxID=2707018 RepID=A0ABD5QP64_9EURY|nr:PGF-CTERM sorting domain-containing protein [Halobellus captivus]
MHRLGSSGVRAVVVALLTVSLLLGVVAVGGASSVDPGDLSSQSDSAPVQSTDPSAVSGTGDEWTVTTGPAGATGTGSLAGTDGSADVDDDTIHVEHALSATDEAGTVGVTTTTRIPDSVGELELDLLTANDDPIETDGFERDDDAAGDEEVWVWDGETEAPSITYRMDANVSVEESGPLATGGTYRFVDTGEWALVRTPRLRISYTGTQVRVDRENVVDGEGVASQAMAFLGPHEEHVREGDEARYRLIEPEAADMEATPEAVFDVFAGAERNLRVGAVDDEVFAVAAPTGDVTWGVRGLQTGDADLWVRDGEPAGTADDVWTHEYVHTRQAYTTDPADPSARWFTEASATYYAALFALDRGATDFESFERTLARGERDPAASSTLAEPGTWRANAPYTKGALVAGEIDRRIRLASDGRASLATVFRELNDDAEPVTNRDFLDAVEAAAGAGGDDEAADEVRAAAERLTATDDPPEMWDRDAHTEAFGGTPAQIGYGLADDGVRATGEYRNRSVDVDPVRLVAGETLALGVDVSNTGGVEGAYDLSLSVGGETVETRNGTVGAGEATTERFEHAFAEPGEYTVRVGGETLTVVVSEPADPLVRGVSTDVDRVSPGGSVTVTATVGNDASIPAGSDLEFRVDGETVGTDPVRLDADAETTVERAVPVPGSGDADTATVSVVGPADEASTTVAIDRDDGDSGSSTEDDVDGSTDGDEGSDGSADDGGSAADGLTDDGIPGFGPVVALVALLSLVGVSARRGRE